MDRTVSSAADSSIEEENTTYKEIPLISLENDSPSVHKESLQSQKTSRSKNQFSSNCLKNTWSYFYNFCDNTSIHGFKFIGERGRMVSEKLCWLIVICMAIVFSTILIYKTYYKWISSPVVVTFAMTETAIWKIPFPAVTICLESNANPSVFNYSDVYIKYLDSQNITEEESKYFHLFSNICNDDLEFIDINKSKFMDRSDYRKFLNAFAELQPKHCKWLGKTYNCSSVLSYTLTTEGWCRTFNNMHHDEIYTKPHKYLKIRNEQHKKIQKWSLEGGYPDNAGLNTYPRRTLLSGEDGGLEIVLYVNKDELDYTCTNLQGFKVTLHHPAEEPEMDKYFRVPFDQAVVVNISPKIISTSNDLISYLPKNRKCYLKGEKLLKNYLVYTQNNCLSECLKNYTIKICNCTPFYMADDNNTICGAGSRNCIKNAKVNFLYEEVINKTNIPSSVCSCLPGCTLIEFEYQTSQINWKWQKSIRSKTYIKDNLVNKSRLSTLSIYYQDLQFMTSERHELYGQLDFLANCGGLLGLFCGFSFTSLIEILYYLTLRLFCNIKKFGLKFWAGVDE